MAECLLSTGLSSMGNEHLCVRMSKDILLRKPFREFYIRGQSFHLLSFPFPNNLLLQLLKYIKEKQPLRFRHIRCLKDRSEG